MPGWRREHAVRATDEHIQRRALGLEGERGGADELPGGYGGRLYESGNAGDVLGLAPLAIIDKLLGGEDEEEGTVAEGVIDVEVGKSE